MGIPGPDLTYLTEVPTISRAYFSGLCKGKKKTKYGLKNGPVNPFEDPEIPIEFGLCNFAMPPL